MSSTAGAGGAGKGLPRPWGRVQGPPGVGALQDGGGAGGTGGGTPQVKGQVTKEPSPSKGRFRLGCHGAPARNTPPDVSDPSQPPRSRPGLGAPASCAPRCPKSCSCVITT